MLDICDIVEPDSACQRKLQKRERPRRDGMGPVEWKNLKAEIGELGQLLETIQLFSHDIRIAVAAEEKSLVENYRKP